MPQLIVRNLVTNEEQIQNFSQEMVTIGRINSCDLEIPDKSVSRKHAEILQEGEDYFLIDLKSGNGTLLNGKKVRPIEKNLLRPNDIIKIENYEIRFLIPENIPNQNEEDTDTDIIEVKMIKKVLGALTRENCPSLEVLNGEAEGKKIFFTEDLQEVDIGRDPKSVLCIDEPVISRHHSKLTRKWGGIVLVDLNSRNGCFVNNERVTEKLLRDGDKIMLGTVKLLYRNPQDINVEAISQEIARKKQQAALREAELMELAAQKKQEEKEQAEKEAQEATEQEKPPQEEAAKSPEAPPPEQQTPPAQQALNSVPAPVIGGLSLGEKFLIGAGALVLIIAIAAIIFIFI